MGLFGQVIKGGGQGHFAGIIDKGCVKNVDCCQHIGII